MPKQATIIIIKKNMIDLVGFGHIYLYIIIYRIEYTTNTYICKL